MGMGRTHTSRRTIGRLVGGVGLLLAGLALVAPTPPAGAQDDPYSGSPPGSSPPGLTIADPAVCQGAELSVTARGARPNEAVTVEFDARSVTEQAGADGALTATFSTQGQAAGTYDVFATSASGAAASAPAFILSPDSPQCSGGDALPRTGTAIAATTAIGAALVAAGIVTFRSRRRAAARST